MKFTLEIDAINSAFDPENSGETMEVARILRDLAGTLEREESFDFPHGRLMDSNGNSAGQWKWIQS